MSFGKQTIRDAEEFDGWDGAALGLQDRTSAEVVAGLGEGIVAGTLIATGIGWRPVEIIAPGDEILTFDEGLVEVQEIIRGALWHTGGDCPRTLWPLTVPAGALGNKAEMVLLPEQYVLVESDTAEAIFGDPFALIPAAALEGYRGIERSAPHRRMDVVRLRFADDQIVYAEGLGMVHCPAEGLGLADRGANFSEAASYTMLPLADARLLVECMAEEGPKPGDA